MYTLFLIFSVDLKVNLNFQSPNHPALGENALGDKLSKIACCQKCLTFAIPLDTLLPFPYQAILSRTWTAWGDNLSNICQICPVVKMPSCQKISNCHKPPWLELHFPSKKLSSELENLITWTVQSVKNATAVKNAQLSNKMTSCHNTPYSLSPLTT